MLLQEVRLHRLLPNLTASLVSSVVGIMISISLAALIFTGQLSDYLPAGISIALFSAIVLRTVVALLSSIPGVIADTDALPSAILGLSAVSIEVLMADSATSEEVFLTVVGAIALTSLLTGGCLLALGTLGAGALIRFIPYPVIGGFVAGTGWLLAHGSLQVMTGIEIRVTELFLLFEPNLLPHWLSGFVLAIVLLIITRRYNHVLVLPLSLIGSIGLFYLVLLMTRTPISEAIDQGWLLGPFGESPLWSPMGLLTLTQVNWSAIISQFHNVVLVAAISPLMILLTASGLEITVDRNVDLNQELRAAGIANIVSGFSGGMVGYQTFSDSVLAYRMGAKSRITGLLTAIWCGVALVLGPTLLSFFPKPILGGLLFYLGLSLLFEWLYDSWFKLPKADYAVVVLILIVISAIGFLQGVAAGLVVAVGLFVVNYSRISITKYVLSGADYQSTIIRPPHQAQLLQDIGNQTFILALQGFIFFGTANRLLNLIQQRVRDRSLPELKFAILDFRLVSGLDSSATISFIKLKRMAQQQQFTLVLTSLSPSIQHVFMFARLFESDAAQHPIFTTLNEGVEWCENQILETVAWRRRRLLPFALQLQQMFSDPDEVSRFITYLERQQVAQDTYLFHQGHEPNHLYFIESGQVAVMIARDDGTAKKLRSLGPGTVLDDVAFYMRSPYSTSAITEQPSNVYCLSQPQFEAMKRETPKTAVAFQEFMLTVLANRLSQTQEAIEVFRS